MHTNVEFMKGIFIFICTAMTTPISASQPSMIYESWKENVFKYRWWVFLGLLFEKDNPFLANELYYTALITRENSSTVKL